MRTFILISLLSLLISLSSNSNAHSLEYSVEFSSEESSSKTITTKKSSSSVIPKKSIEQAKQKTKKESREEKKEQKKISKQQRKEFKKTLWKTIKEQQKINKENRKNGTKEPRKKIHWAAYVAFFGALLALGIFVAAIAIGSMYAIFSYLLPFALLLLPVSIISGIIGVSVAMNDNNEKFDKTYTLVLALVGGLLSFLTLLFIIMLILALSAAF